MTDPTPPPVPAEAPDRQPAYGAVYAVIRRSPTSGLAGALENARVWRAVEAALGAMEPAWRAAGRTAAAAAILAKITEKQAEIDNPDTDAEVLSTLIDECEGLWMALRAADPETFHREHAAARIAEGEAR